MRLFDFIRNPISAEHEELSKQSEKEELNVQVAIDGIDEKEKNLERQAHVLNIQINLLNEVLQNKYFSSDNNPDLPNSIPTDYYAIYQRRIADLQESLEKMHADLLQGRTHVIENDKFVPLNAEKKRGRLKEFKIKITREIANLTRHQQFSISDDREKLIEQLDGLNREYEDIIIRIEELTAAKTNLLLKLQDRKFAFSKKFEIIESEYKELVESYENSLPVLAREGHITKIQRIVAQKKAGSRKFDEKVYVNQLGGEGLNALQEACKYNHKNIVEYLIKRGADVKSRDRDGRYPLHHAVENSGVHLRDIIHFLKNNGAEINALGPYNQTALHSAAYHRNSSAAKILIFLGAKIDIQETHESNERTALHTACFRNSFMVVKFLLEQGANTKLVNKAGETALEEAINVDARETINVFYGLYVDNRNLLSQKDEERLLVRINAQNLRLQAALQSETAQKEPVKPGTSSFWQQQPVVNPREDSNNDGTTEKQGTSIDHASERMSKS